METDVAREMGNQGRLTGTWEGSDDDERGLQGNLLRKRLSVTQGCEKLFSRLRYVRGSVPALRKEWNVGVRDLTGWTFGGDVAAHRSGMQRSQIEPLQGDVGKLVPVSSDTLLLFPSL